MTRKYRLERTAFIGCRNTAYMDVDDAEPCPFCGSRQVTIYPYGQGTTSYVEGVPTLYLSSATCKCRGCTAEIDGPQRKSIIEGEDEYNACIAALKTWNTEKGKELNHVRHTTKSRRISARSRTDSRLCRITFESGGMNWDNATK